METRVRIRLPLFIVVLLLLLGLNTVEAGPCTNNYWQPTFVHDLDNEDGPWYVTASGQFVQLKIVNNNDWIPHACELINKGWIRNTKGYTNCQEYTRIQCGCRRGLSEPNSTCARFLASHRERFPVLPYQQSNNNGGMVSQNLITGGGMPEQIPQSEYTHTTSHDDILNRLGNHFFMLESGMKASCDRTGQNTWKCKYASGTIAQLTIRSSGNTVTMTRTDIKSSYMATAEYEGTVTNTGISGTRIWRPKHGNSSSAGWSIRF